MLQPGNELQGRYQIVRLLGRGGMGAVYEARDLRLETTVAVKDCRFEEPELVRQFEREARLLARLRHPAVTRVIDHFAEGEANYLVMEFIPGDDLNSMIAKGARFTPEQVLAWTDQLLDALEYLHSQQHPVIHRDIKPANLKLMPHGQIILLDFGLAKGTTGQTTLQTGPKSVYGYTPNYAPLEQIHGTEGTDARSDIYSLAATMYHLLTGTMPPATLVRLSKTSDGAPDPLKPVHELNPGVSAAVSSVFGRALSISRERRPSTAKEMRSQLREAIGGRLGVPFDAPPPPPPPPPQPSIGEEPTITVPAARPSPVLSPEPPKGRSGPLLLLLLLLAAFSVAIGTGVVMWMKRERAETPKPPVAESSGSVSSAPSGTLRSSVSRLSSAGQPLAPGSSATIKAHENTVAKLAFSPDGATLASAGRDGTVRIWDVKTRRELRTIRREKREMTVVRFSPDGTMLAVGGYNSSGSLIEVLDPGSGQEMRPALQDNSSLVSDVIFTNDGRIVIVAGSSVRVQDVKTGQTVAQPEGTTNASVAVSRDGSMLAIGGTNENGLKLYDPDGQLLRSLSGHEAGILSVAFSPDGKTVASGSYDSTVRVWPVSGKGEPQVLSIDKLDKPFAVTYSPDGATLAAGTEDQLRLWDMPAGTPRPAVKLDGRCLTTSLAWSPDGKTLALGCAYGDIRLYAF